MKENGDSAVNPWEMTVNHSNPHPVPTDWADLKKRIIANLGADGVCREYQALGIKFEGGPNSKGKIQCHAINRPDDVASAFVAVGTGVYHSKGDGSETLNLFDFALKYGGARFGDWLTTVKHYAEIAKIPLSARKDHKGRILEAVYDYIDEQGQQLYQVLRYRLASGKKDFRQRREDGKGDWIYDLEGVRRILYRLPELIDNPDYHVVIVEGEKDADRLNTMFATSGAHAIATTSAQGAGDTGRWEHYKEMLRGRACSVIPDSDPSGMTHAIGICTYLNGVAGSVRLIELPEVGAKGDVSDWLDQGNTSEDLWKLILEAQAFDPAQIPTQAAADRDATAADLVAAKAGTKWLWPNWIPLGVLTLLTAEPSTGKTRLGIDLTKRIALGMDWPDGQLMDLGDRRPVVIWIPADNQHSELADCPALFGFPPEAIVLNTTVGNLYGGTELQEPEQLADLYKRIVRQHPAMVIIDTITNTSDAKSQDTSDAKRQYKPLQDIAKRTGAAIVCVTHTNVAGKTLGRRADEKTRVTLRLEKPDPDGQPTRRKLSVALTRLSITPAPLGVSMGDAGNTYDFNPPEAPPDSPARTGPKPPAPAVQSAIGYLHSLLKIAPMKIMDIRNDCKTRHPPIDPKNLYAARDYLAIEEYEKEDYTKHKVYKWWRLTEIQASDDTSF